MTSIFKKFEQRNDRGHENLSFFYCPRTKLKAIIAIHSTVLGPALGGCRMRMYQSEEAAIEDVMRLSEGMTYKNSLAGLDLGGGKSCIIADRHLKEGREELFKQFGRYVDRFSGRYYTAEDMGTTVADMEIVRQQTKYCVGFSKAEGSSGNPAPWTALGVFRAMEAISKEVLKKEISDLTVAVEGVGQVGSRLAKHLVEAGAKVHVTDKNQASVEKIKNELGVQVYPIKEIYDVDCDVFSPCAIGQTVNPDSLKRLKSKVILGAANNQLSDNSVYDLLAEKKITYCPGFVINAGGVISVSAEFAPGGWDENWVLNKVNKIYDTILEIVKRAEKENLPTEVIALKMADERIQRKRNEIEAI